MCPVEKNDSDRNDVDLGVTQDQGKLTVQVNETAQEDPSEASNNDEKNEPSSRSLNGTGEHVSDDDTSDPIVVSPQGSPLASVGDDEIFEDAKETFQPPSSRSFITVGLRRKSTPFSLKAWSSLALTLDGRDKITKVFQYASRMLAWWFASRGGRKELALRFASMYKSLSNSRKAFRLGRSFIELEKIRSMGLGPLILWHLQNTLGHNDKEDVESAANKPVTTRPPKIYTRRASSNIGWGPRTMEDEENDDRGQRPSFTRSVSMKVYRAVYRPLRSALSSVIGEGSRSSSTATDLWMALGSTCKMLGLLGFWAGDNINFVLGTGFLDDYSLPTDQRLTKRSNLQSSAGVRANQAYFAGSLAGLFVNVYAYSNFCSSKLAAAEDHVKDVAEEGRGAVERAREQLEKVNEKQFSLFLALLKSVCDIIVFSNNPGIDLHQKWRGKKNHEGFHCLCGLVSASTVIYNNFPDHGR